MIGEIAHIVAEKEDGPRGISPLTLSERNAYPNLLLLCSEHHKFIDDHPEDYPISRLQDMKREHEQWVREALPEFDAHVQHDHEIYAMYIEEWASRALIDHWDGWSSHVMGSGQPKIRKDVYERLVELTSYLFRRIWPKRYGELESAFDEFRRVLSDFLKVLGAELEGDDELLWFRKFYKIQSWNPERYNQLFKKWDFQVALIMDLMLELTRCSNRICERVRKYVDPMYRLREGVLVAETGDIFGYEQIRAEYQDDQITYKTLDEFLDARKDRIPHYGAGRTPDI